jgi:hypothetical protein
MSRRSTGDHAQETNPQRRAEIGMIRRVVIGSSGGHAWQALGARGVTTRQETASVEVFAGIGFWSRPPASGRPEAIVGHVAAEADHPVIVGLRDEKTRRAIAGALGVDETMLFNSVAVLYLKANGTVEARTASGVAVELALKSDLAALRSALGTAAIALGAGGAAAVVTACDVITAPTPWPVGTKKFKAE